MKKITDFTLFVVALVSLLAVLGCEAEENAKLTIYNGMGMPISHFSLVGFDGGKNLLEGGLILNDREEYTISRVIEPGEYTWHVEYEGGMMTGGEDGPEKVEIFPGPNDLALSR